MANSKKECKEQAMISTNICPIWAIPGDKVAGHSEGRDMQHRWYRNMRTPGRAQDLFWKGRIKMREAFSPVSGSSEIFTEGWKHPHNHFGHC